jgi:hypothetical protein
LLNPELYHGKRFTCATALYTLTDMADTWTRVTGKTVRLETAESLAEHTGLSEEQVEEATATGLLAEYGYYGPTGEEDLAWTRKQATVRLRTWEEFVRDNEPWFP